MSIRKSFRAWRCQVKGEEAYSIGDYHNAMKYFRKHCYLRPEHSTGWKWMGFTFEKMGKKDKASECFDKALCIKPFDWISLTHKGILLMEHSNYSFALQMFEKAIGVMPNESFIHVHKGNCLERLRKNKEAIECYNEALRINPADTSALNNKGNALFHLGKLREALQCYEKAQLYKPRNTKCLNNKGVVLMELGKYEEALECFNTVLRLDKNNHLALKQQARALTMISDPTSTKVRKLISPNDKRNSSSNINNPVSTMSTGASQMLTLASEMKTTEMEQPQETVDLIKRSQSIMTEDITKGLIAGSQEKAPLSGGSSDSIDEIPQLSDIEVKQKIGHGHYSEVYLGLWNEITHVALKKLKKDSPFGEFEREARILFSLAHPNLVHFLGLFRTEADTFIVTEYIARGSLYDTMIRKLETLAFSDIMDICLSAASGMAYLEKRKVVHRDLASRNLLLTKVEDKFSVKISDFGLSRLLGDNDSFKSSECLSIRWAAPEIIKVGNFTSKSDVYSFGVIIWECLSGAKQPYESLSHIEAAQAILGGDRLSKPENCPDSLFKLMTDCWNEQPEQRPSFIQVAKSLEEIQGVDFSFLPANDAKDEDYDRLPLS